MAAVVISTYYSVIVAWAMSYAVFSFNLSGGEDTEAFLITDYLNRTVDPGQAGSFVPSVLISWILVWIIVLFILFRGVKKGIEMDNRILIPILIVILLIIVIRAGTLPGAIDGLASFLKPDF